MNRTVARLMFIEYAVLMLALTCAHSQGPHPASKERIRAVWVHPGTFGPDQSVAIPRIQSTLDEYVKAGINTVMVLVKGTSGHVYYKSTIGVRDPAYTWDFFGVFLDEAAKRGIVVHPWFCVFTEGAIVGGVREHPEWLIRSRKSELVPVVNPALPAVRRYEISLMKELVDHYRVGWIHLDYVRYPCEPTEDYFSFDAQTRAAFKERTGKDIAAQRSMDSGNILWNEWIEWNGEQVTSLLRELRKALNENESKVQLSAAVFPDAGNARALIGQDWERWVRDGLLEMLCPMLYTDDHRLFEKYLHRAVTIARGHCLLAAGIGIVSADQQNSPEEMLRQMTLARDLGADGTVLFSSGSLTESFLKTLRP